MHKDSKTFKFFKMFNHTHMVVCEMIEISCIEGIFYVRGWVDE